MQTFNICIVLMLVASVVLEATAIRADGRYKLLKKKSSVGRYENVQGTGRMSESLKKKIMMLFYDQNQKEPPAKGPTYIITIPNQSPTLTTSVSPTTSPTTSSQTLTLTNPTTGLTPDLSPNQSTQRDLTSEEKNDTLEDDDHIEFHLDDDRFGGDDENESFADDDDASFSDDVDGEVEENYEESSQNLADKTIRQASDNMTSLQSAVSGLRQIDMRRQNGMKHLYELNQQHEIKSQNEMKQANDNRLGYAQRQTPAIKRRNRRNKQQQQIRRRKQQMKKRNKRKRLNQQNKRCRAQKKKHNQRRKMNVYRVET